MKTITADKSLIAACGLYCGACKRYLNEKCPGCKKNEKATWCKTKSCCSENNYSSCADCKTVSEAKDCKKVNNLISKFFSLIFRSNRLECINIIKKNGYDKFAREMAEKKTMTIKK
ncbi:MAG: hypothetical protein DKM50_00640 [Candidatus Margulisiibacteriota bacterium]|nr:MAG: hypothetical protein A2X43_05460 [Candidatus Margulisbacteria bacterium GWD2_39_127]OGI04360.1 MAG: hypothetical protein A2X42_07140 [Candidatus Margulisbacteria bacterium GWF2_38_17]OGI07784.1 MAG: hypothetical protein A2X41_07830 [Candidatus Margulisbacteria bacterium GWE2_39_32]PZM84833.1 MAG: hypothetical protein DKM50_00640 [Candidatus Margulisiibacteriota bacterium]HAR63294.1 hypothetical protein [Candidatus Margulisiibacteriota bacterium]